MNSYLVDAGDYLLSIGPYFLGALAIAFMLAVVSVWWSRSILMKISALVALGAMVWFVFAAVTKTDDEINRVVKETNDRIIYLLNNLLSRPKPIAFAALQDMLPEGHPGHLVLYGEVKGNKGIYLLLRSPNVPEPRYYLMVADEGMQKQFKDAEYEAKQKRTQLFLGGKLKGKGGGKSGGGREGDRREGDLAGQGTQRSEGGLGVFHPAPVTEDGPAKSQ